MLTTSLASLLPTSSYWTRLLQSYLSSEDSCFRSLIRDRAETSDTDPDQRHGMTLALFQLFFTALDCQQGVFFRAGIIN